MAVGTHIKPNSSKNAEDYRAHLGLCVPKKAANADTRFPGGLRHCGMRIDDEFYTWEEGEAFVFDDTKEHELWNYGDRTRIILSFRFNRPSPGRPLEKVGTFYSDK
jgi:beta-hydroxylase